MEAIDSLKPANSQESFIWVLIMEFVLGEDLENNVSLGC